MGLGDMKIFSDERIKEINSEAETFMRECENKVDEEYEFSDGLDARYCEKQNCFYAYKNIDIDNRLINGISKEDIEYMFKKVNGGEEK